ncbi:peptidoglycan DD-metalloendopeptidase family protein [Flavobacteriaceae bacterium]|nr:peptidoglycan DD-metalloendopeptidase family protein [Flavobacteriaceae bacterium]
MGKKAILLLFVFCISLSVFAQDSRQKKLEAQRKQLEQEIKQINTLLFSNTKKKKSALTEVEDLAVKINLRQRLIRVTNEEANRLTQQINVNQRTIDRQRKELQVLKDDYADMIRFSYASKSGQSRLMFLFSSDNFLQAYKRFQYLKQYTSFRKKQGELIAEKTLTLQALNKDLLVQKQRKQDLVSANQLAQVAYEKERMAQKDLVTALKKRERSFASQIRKKQQKIAAFDKEIQRLIRAAIAASNKAAGKGNAAAFTLTPEAQLIGKNFSANKGKLPWPVEKGVVTLGFGTQPHPVVKTTKIQSNGVTIATPDHAEVRAVFEGIVLSIISFKGSNPAVLIQHGNYITSYSNLETVFVKKGQKVASKETIGKVFTHPNTGKTELKFGVFQTSNPVNPRGWVYRM